jgi:hypothetical protein
MSASNASPAFGGKLKNDAFYTAVNGIINVLRPASSLRVIATHLTNAGFQTPTGLPWNRHRVSDYIRNVLNKEKETNHD